MSKKIFIATAMSHLSLSEYKSLKEKIKEIKRKHSDYEIFSEITNIDNHDSFMTPKDATLLDISEIEKCDEFIIIHVSNIQSSTLFELGIAFNLKKRITIFYKEIDDLPFMVKELDKVTINVTMKKFENFKEITF